MKIFKVIGNLTLNRCHPSVEGACLLLAEPEGQATLGGESPKDPDLVVVWDELGAGVGSTIALSDSAEAAQPFRPEIKPVSAYCSAILDAIHIDPKAVELLKSKR